MIEQPDNNFNHNSSQHPLPDGQDFSELQDLSNEEAHDFSHQSLQIRKKEIQRLFFLLLITGLVLGGLVAFGVVKLLNQFGLTDNQPNPFDRYNTEQLDQ